MSTIEVRTQSALDEAIATAGPGDIIAIRGDGVFYAYDSAQVRASGSAQVTASGSAQVTASDSAQVRASGSAQVTASKYVAVTIHGTRCTIKGGVQIKLPALDTPAAWCEYHGVRVVKGVATLYKAVADDWTTPYSARAGIAYAPGATVEAPDWEPTPSCGAGLHAVPHTVDGLAYYPEATRYVAVTAPLDSLVVIDDGKVKAPRLTVKGEVTADGRPVRKAAAK